MRRTSPLLLFLCAGLSILWGLKVGSSAPGGVIGFQGVYYGTRCLLNHCDPYQEGQLIQHYRLEGHALPSDSIQRRKAVTLYVNLPATFLFIAPFALLPWAPAQALWIVLLIGLFLTAAFLVWSLAADYSPGIALLLASILLINCEVLFATGNTAGIVVSLSVIAVWCFLRERFTPVGILCFAAALAIKPHDAGLLWLFFLLAGATHRKRALQAVAITCALTLAAVGWLTHVAPHWLPEMRSNLAAISLPGGLNEPGLSSMTGHTAAMVIDLQAVTSAIWNDPHTYNLASYLVCGILIVVWAFTTLRTRFSVSNAWLAVATAVPITLLIAYHRPYDAKLLLLTIPACTILWAERGLRGWLALGLTTAGIVCTGDFFLAALTHITRHLDCSGASPARRILVGVIAQPVPLILLALAVFYLSIYVQQSRKQRDLTDADCTRSVVA
jgi:hypothetical protein